MEDRINRIRNLRRKRMNRGSSSITYSKTEPYALCYYLFNMFDNKSNRRIIEHFDSAISIFMESVELLDKKERLANVLRAEIFNLEGKNILSPLKEVSESMSFDDAGIPYRYEQDKKIEREMRHFDNADENLINLCRVLSVSEKPVFSSIINATIFKTGNSYTLNQNISLSKPIEKAVFDISKTQFLVDQVKLTENEARLILMKCRLETIESFRDIIRSADNCDNGFKNRMADMIGVSENELKYMMRGDQKLRTFGFLDDDGDYDNTLNDCIEEQNIDPYFNDVLKPLDCSSAYALESYSLNEESVEVSLDLLKAENPVSLLFYGKPGSGKTELAKSLCKETNKKVFIFKNEEEANNRGNILGRLVCLLSMERPDSILVVDEADTLIKTMEFSFFGRTPTKTKGTINKMLENNKNKVIYIINHQRQIDDSTLRRFTFSIKFEAMSQAMLHSIAQSKIQPLSISQETKKELLNMLDRYKLSGSSVENIVKVIEGMRFPDEKRLLQKAQIVMKENSLLLNGKAKMRETVNKEYDLSIVNASMNPKKIVEMVQNAEKYAEKNKGEEKGIRMLFYGLSGTGKTEFARYIADTLHKPILLKRASDILSCWVGESEQNIRDAFEEAERTGSILLFDEADSFFQDRSNAQHSWEITQVNEFLTQMEEFSGILICTTNLRKIMDPAIQRRFHILTEFKALSEDGIRTLCSKFFPDLQFTDEQIALIEKYKSATPGDFASIHGRYRFMNEEEQTATFITSELETLQKEKKKNVNADLSMGFTA